MCFSRTQHWFKVKFPSSSSPLLPPTHTIITPLVDAGNANKMLLGLQKVDSLNCHVTKNSISSGDHR